MIREEAHTIVNAYRAKPGRVQPPANEYMAYMRARGVLDKLGVERLTAGQRGFLDAATTPLTETPA